MQRPENVKRMALIATPTRDGKAHARMMVSIMGLQTLAMTGKSRGTAFGIDISQGSPNIPRQRNWAVAIAEKSGCDYIVFVDSDIEFEPQHLVDLLEKMDETGCRVVGASHQTRARQWTDKPNMSGVFGADGSKKPVFDNECDFLRAHRLTTGLLAIHMSVFKQLRESRDEMGDKLAKQFVANAVPDDCWPYLYGYFMHDIRLAKPDAELSKRLEAVGLDPSIVGIMDGEDWDFNERCTAAQIPMYIEPLMPLRHYEGSHAFNLDLPTYWARYEDEDTRERFLEWLSARAGRGCQRAIETIKRGPVASIERFS